MHLGIAINLRRRGLKNLRVHSLGEPQHVDGAVHARLSRLHGIKLVVDRGGWTSEVVDFIDLNIERKRNIMAPHFEPGVATRCAMFDLLPVKKLSTQRTSCPIAMRRSHGCEPKNPAPPVTRTF